MREYEVTFIIQPQLEEELRNQLIERVLGWLKPENGGEDVPEPKVTHWGQRHLAYPINKFTEGYYVMVETQLDPTRIRDIERNLQFAEDIIRYLVVHKVVA